MNHLQSLMDSMITQQGQGTMGVDDLAFDSNRFFEVEQQQPEAEPMASYQMAAPNHGAGGMQAIDPRLLQDLFKSLSGESNNNFQSNDQSSQANANNLSTQFLNAQFQPQQVAIQQPQSHQNLLYSLLELQKPLESQQFSMNNQQYQRQMMAQQAFDVNSLFCVPPSSADTPLNTYVFNNNNINNGVNFVQARNLVQPPVAKPVKALSAYNFFFRVERDRIINGIEAEYTPSKAEELLSDHWFRDRSAKRRHRKTHGKIAFTDLSRIVSQRWKELEPEKKEFFKQVAAKDLERYRRDLEEMENQGNDINPVKKAALIARSA